MSEKVQAAIQAIDEKAGPLLRILGEVLSVALPIALEVLRVAVTATFDTIVFAIQVAWEIVSGVLETIILFLSGDFAGAWNRLQEMVSGVWDAIASYIVGIVDRIVTFLENTGVADIGRAVGRAFQAAYDAVVSWLDSALDNVIRWVANVLSWFSTLPGLIGQAFTSAGNWLYNAGRDIVAGLINGLIDKAKDLVGVVNDWIVNPIKKALGGAAGFLFGSPSKVTTQYGQWISDGLAIGIKDAESSVVAAAESLTRAAALPGMTAGRPNMGVVGSTPFVPDLAPVAAAGTGGVVFGPGAVQVVFQGVVPSEAEAFATGQAVGAGIADVIARRDARVSVGVL
jgi:phage-related protein